jgi:putative glutamine amidotransferase
LPVFGICRGMQLINCRLNGSLISDIETIRGTNHRKISNTEDRMHNVNVADGTLLRSIIKENSGIVNSSHHQAVDRLGEGLRISAKSDDGIIEGFEWDDKSGKSFLIGVQWHPERMNDKESPFSKNLMLKFIEEIEKNNS